MKIHKNRHSLIMRVFFLYGLMLLAMAVILYALFFRLSKRTVLDQTQKSMASALMFSDEQISESMKNIEQQTQNLMVDPELNKICRQLKLNPVRNNILYNGDFIWILAKIINSNNVLDSISMTLGDQMFIYNYNTNVDYKEIMRSELWEQILKGNGSALWFPPSVTDKIYDIHNENAEFMWMARKMNMTDLQHFSRVFQSDEMQPVLIVTCRKDYLSSTMLGNMPITGCRYMLTDADATSLGKTPCSEAVQTALKRAYLTNKVSGELFIDDTLYCYRRMAQTGWYHVVSIDSGNGAAVPKRGT